MVRFAGRIVWLAAILTLASLQESGPRAWWASLLIGLVRTDLALVPRVDIINVSKNPLQKASSTLSRSLVYGLRLSSPYHSLSFLKMAKQEAKKRLLYVSQRGVAYFRLERN